MRVTATDETRLRIDTSAGLAVLVSAAAGERTAATYATTLNVALDGALAVHDGTRTYRARVIVTAPGLRRVSLSRGPVLSVLLDADDHRAAARALGARGVVALDDGDLVAAASRVAELVLAGQADAALHARALGARVLPSGPAPLADPRIEEALVSLAAGPRALAELAARAGLSPSHFSELFSATVGLPLKSWALWQRVKRSLGALEPRGPDASPTSGAARAAHAGFADQAHMTRTYARLLGYTPGALARAARPR